MTSRNTYIAKMKLQLDDLNNEMARLESKTQVAKEEARDKYKEEMGKLRHQSKLAMAKLDEVMAAGEETWDSMVTDMEKVRDAFSHSFHYFKSQL